MRALRGLSRAAALVVAVGAFSWAACDRMATKLSGGVGPESGMLRGKLPSASRGVNHLQRLTDGIAAEVGDPWRTDLTAVMTGPEPFVTWDLGADVPVRCVLVEADGDDTYFVSLSKDGSVFTPLWTAGADEEAGQQLRAARGLTGTGRYLRFAAARGDGRWSAAEVSAWSDCPKEWPPLAMQKGASLDEAVLVKLWAFEALALLFVLAYRRRLPDWAKLLGVVPVGIGVSLALQLADLWPLQLGLALKVAGALAALAVAIAIRVGLARRTRASAARLD